MKKNSGVLEFDVEKLKSISPKRPSKWNYKQVKSFLKKFVKIDRVRDIFDEQEVDGKLFLSFNSNNEIFDILNLKRSDEKILMEWQKLLLDYENEKSKKKPEEPINKPSSSTLEKNVTKKNKKKSSEEKEEEEEKIEKSEKIKKKKEKRNSKEEDDFKDSSKKKTEKMLDKFESRDEKIEEKENKHEKIQNSKERKKHEKRKDDDFENSSEIKFEKTVDIFERSAKSKHDKTVEIFETSAEKIKEKSFEPSESKAKIKTKEVEFKTQINDYNGKKTDKNSKFNDNSKEVDLEKKNQKIEKISQKDSEKKIQSEKNVKPPSDDEEGKSETIIRGSDKKQDFKFTKSEPINKAKNEEKKFPEINSNKLSKVNEESDFKKNAKEKNGDKDKDQDITVTQVLETKEKKPIEIAINVVDETAQHKTYYFLKSFQICRADKNIDGKEHICLVDSQISKNHAQIIPLKKLGFYLQDLGSTNHTYIKLPKNTRIKLREGFELLIGNSLFKILRLTKTQIRLETNKMGCKEKMILEIKMTKDKLFFGKNPTPEDPKNDDVYQFIEDSEIEKTHVVFHKEQERFLLEPKISTKCVWLKIGEKGKSSDFYLLKKFSAFKLGEVLLKVERTYSKKGSLCKRCQEKIINTVFLPCNHAKLCETCAGEENRCMGRKLIKKEKISCESREYKRFIDLFELD